MARRVRDLEPRPTSVLEEGGLEVMIAVRQADGSLCSLRSVQPAVVDNMNAIHVEVRSICIYSNSARIRLIFARFDHLNLDKIRAGFAFFLAPGQDIAVLIAFKSSSLWHPTNRQGQVY